MSSGVFLSMEVHHSFSYVEPVLLSAKAAAVFLGSFSYGPPGPAVIKALWTDGVQGGGYASLGYKNESTTWHQTEVAKYFDYLLGLIF